MRGGFGGIVDEGVGLCTGDEGAFGGVAAIGEGFGGDGEAFLLVKISSIWELARPTRVICLEKRAAPWAMARARAGLLTAWL